MLAAVYNTIEDPNRKTPFEPGDFDPYVRINRRADEAIEIMDMSILREQFEGQGKGKWQ